MNNKDLQLSRPDRPWLRYLLLPCSRMSIHFTVQPFNTPARKSFRIAACSHKRTVILVQHAFCNKPKRNCATADRESRGIFNRLVLPKTDVGLRKVCPDLEISEAFWMSLEVPNRSFFLSVWSSRVDRNFSAVRGNSLSN